MIDDRSQPPRPGPPPLPIPVQPLEYSPEPRPFRLSFGGRFAAGFFGYLLICCVWAGGANYAKVPIEWAVYGWLGLTVAAISVGVYLRLRYHYSGVGYGVVTAMLSASILIVIGVVLLILSICFGWVK